jgi:hypothetical protein
LLPLYVCISYLSRYGHKHHHISQSKEVNKEKERQFIHSFHVSIRGVFVYLYEDICGRVVYCSTCSEFYSLCVSFFSSMYNDDNNNVVVVVCNTLHDDDKVATGGMMIHLTTI